MKLKLGNNQIFHCPEGKWIGTCESAEEPKKKINKLCKSQVRLRFRILSDEGTEYIVAKTFCADLSYGSELYCFLESWTNGKYDKFLDDYGNVDLDLFIGQNAALLITHVQREGPHDHPFVNIAGIYPEGILTQG